MAKAKKRPPIYYWDSCVFTSYFEKTAGRVEVISALLEEAAKGEVHIITSIATMTEVAYIQAERDNGRVLDPEVEATLDKMWLAGSPVHAVVDVHPMVATAARTLIRHAMSNGRRLTPMDAIHLATARQRGVAGIHTYDKNLRQFSDDVGGIPIIEPRSDRFAFPVAGPPDGKAEEAVKAPEPETEAQAVEAEREPAENPARAPADEAPSGAADPPADEGTAGDGEADPSEPEAAGKG